MRWSIVLTPVTRWPRTSLAILVSINTPYNVYLSYRTSDSHVIPRSYKTFWPIYKKDILSFEFPSTRKINLNNKRSLKKIKENKDLALNRFLNEFKAHKALMTQTSDIDHFFNLFARCTRSHRRTRNSFSAIEHGYSGKSLGDVHPWREIKRLRSGRGFVISIDGWYGFTRGWRNRRVGQVRVFSGTFIG